MHKMNEKGQAFSVFKLLIAAVVAGAILLILLQTLQVLPNIGSRTPNEVASNAVKSQINEPGLPVIIENVTFDNGDTLFNKTIAEKSRALSTDQVCVAVSDDAPNADSFEVIDGKTVRYNGSFGQQVRLLVICDRGGELEESLDAFRYIETFDLTFDGCNTDSDNTNRLCYISVIAQG
ncbi:hypothetical protein IIC68_00180 [archaeon]|nr:hypothetical protein [archaeon]